jgi:glycerol-3-phosphate dehydrogenase
VKEEMAASVEDVLFRRTKLGISFPKDKVSILNDVLKKYL